MPDNVLIAVTDVVEAVAIAINNSVERITVEAGEGIPGPIGPTGSKGDK